MDRDRDDDPPYCDDYNDYYRMLLELDESGAYPLAIRYCDTHGFEATFDRLSCISPHTRAGDGNDGLVVHK